AVQSSREFARLAQRRNHARALVLAQAESERLGAAPKSAAAPSRLPAPAATVATVTDAGRGGMIRGRPAGAPSPPAPQGGDSPGGSMGGGYAGYAGGMNPPRGGGQMMSGRGLAAPMAPAAPAPPTTYGYLAPSERLAAGADRERQNLPNQYR